MLDLIADSEIVLSFKNKDHAKLLLELVNKNRAYLRKWMRWVDDTNHLEDINNFIEHGDETNIYHPSFAMAIWYRNELCGIVGFNNGSESDKSISIGYWVSENYQGKGIATKACKRLINFAFSDFDLKVMHLHAGTENERSKKVAEKLGFSFDMIKEKAQVVNNNFIDLASYSLTRKAWEAKKEIYS